MARGWLSPGSKKLHPSGPLRFIDSEKVSRLRRASSLTGAPPKNAHHSPLGVPGSGGWAGAGGAENKQQPQEESWAFQLFICQMDSFPAFFSIKTRREGAGLTTVPGKGTERVEALK